MSDPVETKVELQIAHVLFIDTVGYSKLSINEQRRLFDQLNRVVRSAPQFRVSESSGQFLRLPTGDGMALVFYDNPEAPAQCALEIARAVADVPDLPLRMGIHSGPVSRVTDVNDQLNVAGAGINIAQRVMSCGDAGHILLSKGTADDLGELQFWKPFLRDLGECEVKHGLRLQLVNLCGEGAGNARMPTRCGEAQQKRLADTRRGHRKIFFAFAAVVLLLAAVGFFLLRDLGVTDGRKSIAVLPFENFSDDREHEHLADGVQDEILKDLGRVADLKVVSRTSVMQYKGQASRNLREIAKQLGVRHILEGSVQCQAKRVRVTAQLIDAASDTHLWSQTYDGDLSDVFALESGLAEKIVAELRAKLSPREKAAIEQWPTKNLAAQELYISAKNLIEQSVFTPGSENLEEALRLLGQAVLLDPTFGDAYFQLAHAHDQMFQRNFDHSGARLQMAAEAIKKLQQLRPDSGEAHLAQAKHLYWGYRDYDRARRELLLAQQTLPNDSTSFLLLGYIDRRQGRWNESTENMEHALELDPQNPQNILVLQQLAKSFECLRNYSALRSTLQRALERSPRDQTIRIELARVELDNNANTGPLRSVLQAIAAEDPEAARVFASQSLVVALYDRDSEAATRALTKLSPDASYVEAAPFPRSWSEGEVARLRGDSAAAAQLFAKARAEVEKLVSAEPDNGPVLSVLGMLDAALGQTEAAIREGRRAVDLLPLSKDSINGALLMENLAVIYAWCGHKPEALDQLAAVVKIPSYLSYGDLRLHPIWDPLRGDPRFEDIVRSLKPKTP